MHKLITVSLFVSLFTFGACGGGGKSDGIGVPECDQYLEKVQTCAKKVGGITGDSLERGAKMFADAWKHNAKDASMKDQLPKTCTDATAAAKKQFSQCEW